MREGTSLALTLAAITAAHLGATAPASAQTGGTVGPEVERLLRGAIWDGGDVERTESATSAAISMPRFIGPGCMTIASSDRVAIRSASRP